MKIETEFFGGLESHFESKKLSVELDSALNIKFSSYFDSLVSDHLKHRPNYFVRDGSVRPGILVVINGLDWELREKADTLLNDGDSVAFISTIHGG